MIRSLLLAGAGALALAACGQTATPPPQAPAEAPASAAAAMTPNEFAAQVLASDAFEVQASQLAATNASAANVKAFAREMATAHTATTQELTAALRSLGETAAPPATLSSQQNADLEALRAARGTAFDTLYISQQVQAHQNAVQLFQTFTGGAAEGPVKAWATTTLPALQTHLTNAQALMPAGATTP